MYFYKVRFNLGRGENYKKWKISKYGEGVKYLDPEKFSLTLSNCYLYNNSKIANRIYTGQNKTVCAWVQCENLEINKDFDIDYLKLNQVEYNPKILPYWHLNKKNIDRQYFSCIFTKNNKLYIKNE